MPSRQKNISPKIQFGRVPYESHSSVASLNGSATKVYLVLCIHANRDWIAWPSRSRIAKLAGINPRTVSRAINELKVAGLVTVEKGGPTKPNRYRLDVGASAPLAQSHDAEVPMPAGRGASVPRAVVPLPPKQRKEQTNKQMASLGTAKTSNEKITMGKQKQSQRQQYVPAKKTGSVAHLVTSYELEPQ